MHFGLDQFPYESCCQMDHVCGRLPGEITATPAPELWPHPENSLSNLLLFVSLDFRLNILGIPTLLELLNRARRTTAVGGCIYFYVWYSVVNSVRHSLSSMLQISIL
jgi:hypothetical protein